MDWASSLYQVVRNIKASSTLIFAMAEEPVLIAMARVIMATGTEECTRAGEYLCPRPRKSMWVIGQVVRNTARGDTCLAMGTSMMVSSVRTRHTESGHIIMLMATSTLGNG